MGFVLENAVSQVVGDADIESATRCALQDVHVKVVFTHGQENAKSLDFVGMTESMSYEEWVRL